MKIKLNKDQVWYLRNYSISGDLWCGILSLDDSRVQYFLLNSPYDYSRHKRPLNFPLLPMISWLTKHKAKLLTEVEAKLMVELWT